MKSKKRFPEANLKVLNALGLGLMFVLYASDGCLASQAVDKKTSLRGSVESYAVLSESVQSAAGFTVQSNEKGIVVTAVNSDSPSSQANIEKGDKILSAELSANNLNIKIERNKRVYQANLTIVIPGGPLAKQSPKVDGEAKKANGKVSKFRHASESPYFASGKSKTGKNFEFWWSPGLCEDYEKLMACYDVELMVDWSPSMNYVDEPGDISRRQWCNEQITALVKALKDKGGHVALTICHNNQMKTYDNVQEKSVAQIFGADWKSSRNDMADLLDARTSQFLDRRSRQPGAKPLLLSILTDKNPSDCFHKASLATASTKMSDPRELIVGFTMLGPDWKSKYNTDLCMAENPQLDDDLRRVAYCDAFGVRYPIMQITGPVQTVYHGVFRSLCFQMESALLGVKANGWFALEDPNPNLSQSVNMLSNQWSSFYRDSRVQPGGRVNFSTEKYRRMGEAWNQFPLCGIPWTDDLKEETRNGLTGGRISQTEMRAP